jgi:hypothetical protein
MSEIAVGLSDAIAALRKELATALSAGKDEDVKLRLGPVELEFLLDVKREGGGSGGIRFWVVSLEGKTVVSHDSLHRIKLSLQPVQAGHEGMLEVSRSPNG